MSYEVNHNNKKINFNDMGNLYLREKKVDGKFCIDKFDSTNHPAWMKIKHFFVSLFTEYKYSTGASAVAKIQLAGGSVKLLNKEEDVNADKANDLGMKNLFPGINKFKKVEDNDLMNRLDELDIKLGDTKHFALCLPENPTAQGRAIDGIYNNTNGALLITEFFVTCTDEGFYISQDEGVKLNDLDWSTLRRFL